MINAPVSVNSTLDRTADVGRLTARGNSRRVNAAVDGVSEQRPVRRRAKVSAGEAHLPRSRDRHGEPLAVGRPEVTSAARLLALMIEQMGGAERSYVKGSFVDFAI